MSKWREFLVASLFILIAAPGASALEPDQIALVVNSRVPAGRELAEFYAQKRNIPAGRIIALELPFPEEEMPYEAWDRDVVPAVRSFLRDNGLKDKVTCLVTFWGVPLRVAQRKVAPPEATQLELITAETQKTQGELDTSVAEAEALAKELVVGFAPGQGRDLQQSAKRAGDAMTAAMRSIARMPEGDRRNGYARRLIRVLERLSGEPEVLDRMSSPDFARLAPDPMTPQQLAQAKQRALGWKKEFEATQGRQPSAENFEAMRRVVREHFGLFRYAALLAAQKAVYDPKDSESAFDSELSLVWWDNNYARAKWQGNALSYKVRDVPAGTPPTLMVTRLDGPTAGAVDRIILSSLKAEKQGLVGQVVLDARGNHGDDGYGRYDQTIRNLADLLKAKTQLKVTLDDRDPIIQPGPDAPKDVAVYCGWYSLRNYVPVFKFTEGAVGFHVASSELVSLRGENERGWVRGLLNDGVSATVGPVAEPYLHSFPQADEFFPLLLTGKLALAEVYWKTNPLTSWMNTCIGDPLYTPFKLNPAMKVEDLPERLQVALRGAPAPSRAPASPPSPAPPPGSAK